MPDPKRCKCKYDTPGTVTIFAAPGSTAGGKPITLMPGEVMTEFLSFCRPGGSEIIIPVTIRGEAVDEDKPQPKTVTSLQRLMAAYLAIDSANSDPKNPIVPPLDIEWVDNAISVKGVCEFDAHNPQPGVKPPKDAMWPDPPNTPGSIEGGWFRFSFESGVKPVIPGQQGGGPAAPPVGPSGPRTITPASPSGMRIRVGGWLGTQAPATLTPMSPRGESAPPVGYFTVVLTGISPRGLWLGRTGIRLPASPVPARSIMMEVRDSFSRSGWRASVVGPDVVVSVDDVELVGISCWADVVAGDAKSLPSIEVGVPIDVDWGGLPGHVA